MTKYAWNDNEVKDCKDVTDAMGTVTRQFNYPCSEVENIKRLYKQDPVWMPFSSMAVTFTPKVIPDNIARAFVFDANPLPKSGGIDMFGIKWVLEEKSGGCIEDPSIPPILEDANDWEKVIKWPDIDAWDWAGSAKENEAFLHDGKPHSFVLLNGFGFERLISFMGFMGASMALIDEEQEDAVKAIFEKTSDLMCRIIDKAAETYGDGIQIINVHDDWGSQKDCFFSPEVGKEFFVPVMKKVTDRIKEHGYIADLHSCGCNEKQFQNIIEGGWQSWTPMPMNDTRRMYHEIPEGSNFILGVVPEAFDKENTSVEEQRELGREFVRKFPKAVVSNYFRTNITPDFCQGVYEESRKLFL